MFRFLNIHFSPQFQAYLLIILQDILNLLLVDYLCVFLGCYLRVSATVSLPLLACSCDCWLHRAGRTSRLLYSYGGHVPRGIKESVSMLVCVTYMMCPRIS